jgi:hypothetical protein
MKHISHRSYQGHEDFQTVIELLARVRPPGHINDYPVKVDIEENLASAATRANMRLWFDDAQHIAWAYVDEFNNFRWELDSHYEESIGKELVEWGESCIRKTLASGEASALDASCREDYKDRITFLKRHGFFQTRDTTI